MYTLKRQKSTEFLKFRACIFKALTNLAHSGKITQECTKYSFGFDAASYGGASGSPIFNAKGQLIGVLNSGVSKSQGFNYGIKATHVKELLNQAQTK